MQTPRHSPCASEDLWGDDSVLRCADAGFHGSFAQEREKRGDPTRMARLMPSMSTTERDQARNAAGEIPQRAIEAAQADMAASQASSPSRRPHVKASPRPSTAPEPKSKKKPRRQDG